eukprot:scaffold193824_cov54-Attheya_sp.AAC.1
MRNPGEESARISYRSTFSLFVVIMLMCASTFVVRVPSLPLELEVSSRILKCFVNSGPFGYRVGSLHWVSSSADFTLR